MVGRVTRDELPITALRRFYDALLALREQEQTELAELHAQDAQPLIHRFRETVKVLENLPLIDLPFYPVTGRKPLPSPTTCDEIVKTPHFASALSDGRPLPVRDGEELGFHYIDREISPLRTAMKGVPRRSLDLVLANIHDQTPILAELKIRSDKLAYFALVQVLMLTVELVVPARGARLRAHPPASHLVWRDPGPLVDVYIVAFESPATGQYRDRSIRATERIARQLADNRDISRWLRRIAYLDAGCELGALAFKKRFSFAAL
jgi:hypothetical protein